MRNRVAVAAPLIPLIYVLAWSPWQHALLFALLASIATTMAAIEVLTMFSRQRPFVPAALIVTAITPILAWGAMEVGMIAGLVVVIPLTMIFAMLSVERADPVSALATTVFAAWLIALPGGLFVALRGSPHGFALVMLLLVGVWSNDTAAYLGGRAFGSHQLAPRLSPKKTVEGLICGCAAGIAVVWYGRFVAGDWLSGMDALTIGVAIALATPVGDLFESMLKRATYVKDSSHLLGEHGGMLDRLDALLLAAPAMYLAAFFVGVL